MRLPLTSPFLNHLLRRSTVPAAIGLFLYFCAGFASGALLPFFALWAKQDVGVPTASIGLLLGCYSGGELLATPVIGGLADRIGRRPVLLLSTLGVGVGFLLLYAVHDVVLAAFALLVIGMFESVLHPTISTVIAESAPMGRTRHYFALAQVASNAGRILGPATGALLALLSLRSVFLGVAAASLAGFVVAALWLPETWSKGRSEAQDDKGGPTGMLLAFRDKRLAGMLFWTVCLQIPVGWIGAVLPLYASDSGLLTPAQVGMLFTYSAVVIVLLQITVARLVEKFPVRE